MRLSFRPTTGVEFSLLVGSYNTILQIKTKIHQEIGIPIWYQTMYYNGVRLPDNLKLSNTSISPICTIDLSVSPPAPHLSLIIRSTTRHPFPIHLPHRSITVLQIKENIQQQSGIPIASQTLFHNGHLLQDHLNLIDTNVRDFSTLLLVIAGDPPLLPLPPPPPQQQLGPPLPLLPLPPFPPPPQQWAPPLLPQQGFNQHQFVPPQGHLHHPPPVNQLLPPGSPMYLLQGFHQPPPQLGPPPISHPVYLLRPGNSVPDLIGTVQQPVYQQPLHQLTLLGPQYQLGPPPNLQQGFHLPQPQFGLPTTSHQEMGSGQTLGHQRPPPQAPAATASGSGNQRLVQSMPLPTTTPTQKINLTLQISPYATTLDRDQTMPESNQTLDFDQSLTIRQMKEMIGDTGGVSAERLTLFFNGNELEDDQNLSFYEIPDGSVIEVTVADLSSPAPASESGSENKN